MVLLVQAPHHLHGFEVDAHRRRGPRRQRAWQVSGNAGKAHQGGGRGGRSRRADDELALHAGRAVARHGAEVGELARFVGAEDGHAARPFLGHALRGGIEVGEGDVMFDAVVVEEVDLDDGSLPDPQRGVHDPVDVAAHADEGELPFGQGRPEADAEVGHVLRRGALRRALGAWGHPRRLGHVVEGAGRRQTEGPGKHP